MLRSGSIFLRQESSAQLCLHSQHGEKIRGYIGCLKLFGQVAAGVAEAVRLKRRNVSEGAILSTPIQQVGNSQGCAVAASRGRRSIPNHHQLLWVFERQRLQ